MLMEFSKVYLDGKTDAVDITVDWYGGKVVVPCVLIDGKIDALSVSMLHNGNETETDLLSFNIEATHKYNEMLKVKKDISNQRKTLKQSNHWWNAMPVDDKLALCINMKDHIYAVVDAILDANPEDIKRRHYSSLISRSKQTPCVTAKLDASKIARLPRYDASTNKLIGSKYAFISLFEVIYPPIKRTEGVMRF